MEKISIKLDIIKADILDAAKIRLSYLYPSINFSIEKKTIIAEGLIENKETLLKEINYTVYREKIYKENIEVRKKIYEDF